MLLGSRRTSVLECMGYLDTGTNCVYRLSVAKGMVNIYHSQDVYNGDRLIDHNRIEALVAKDTGIMIAYR